MDNLETEIKKAIRDIKDFPKEGIVFKDITPILLNPLLCQEITENIFNHFSGKKIDAILAIESRGFLFGMLLAQKFKVPFVPVRKKGKLPYKTFSFEYQLEYGSATVEIHNDALAIGSNVLIHDDLLATGGTATAAAELAKNFNANVVGYSFIVELDFLNGRSVLEKYTPDIFSLVRY
ncbi:MAG: adenine phosphoribosyltransferase [Proteobacteria bacterium]|nr:adenine phosphoribosyltransferase [Pseudomonadota bacterium]